MSPRLTRGQREYTGLMGSSPEEGLAEVRLRSPQMYDAVVEGAFGQMMAQGGLSRAAREMTTVALLAAAGGAERQLTTHARAALRHGVAPAELRACASMSRCTRASRGRSMRSRSSTGC